MGNTMTPQQRAALLSTYVPHRVMVEVDWNPLRRGILEIIDYVDGKQPAALRVRSAGGGPEDDLYPSATEVRPVLYSLAELPHLPGEQLARVVHLLDIVASEERGAGEYVSSVSVIRATPREMHLAVITGYTYPDTSYHNEYDELVEPDPPTDEEVADEIAEASDSSPSYEVIIDAWGDIDWRPVPNEQGQREPFRPLRGSKVLLAVDYLQGLHVAIGAWMHLGEERYVRQALQQEGGPAQ